MQNMEIVCLKQREAFAPTPCRMQETLRKTKFDVDRRNAVWNMPSGFGPFPPTAEGEPSIVEQFDGPFDWIMVFVYNTAQLREFGAKAMQALTSKGLVWFCFPKKASKIKTDINRDNGWEVLDGLDIKYVNLVSVDDTWSGFGVTHGTEQQYEKQSKEYEARQDLLAPYLNYKTRKMSYPPEMVALLDAHPDQKAFFFAQSFTNRKEYLAWIVSAKREETKTQRLSKMIDYLKEGRKNPAGR
jgi:hypothetical protein